MNGKVAGLTAHDPAKGNLQISKVKSAKKLADLAPYLLPSGTTGTQFAQTTVYYYGYCFDDGFDEWCYWFTEEYVVVDDTWVIYVEG